MVDAGKKAGGSPIRRSRISPTRRGDFRMRGILFAMLVAGGVGLAGSAGVSAAPINGAAINDAANAASPVEQVQHWRWGSGGGYGGGHWGWGRRGGPWRHGRPGGRGGVRPFSGRVAPPAGRGACPT